MDSVFRRIKSTYGTFAIMGNHEYRDDENAHFIEKAGIYLLRDSAVLIDSLFYIVGREDKSNIERKSLEKLIACLDTSKPVILLDHQPFHLEEAEKNNGITRFSVVYLKSFTYLCTLIIVHGE